MGMEEFLLAKANEKVVEAVLAGADIYPIQLSEGRWAFVVAQGPVTTEMAERASRMVMALAQDETPNAS